MKQQTDEEFFLESGWTKKEWNKLVAIVESKDKMEIMNFLEKHRDYEFGTPLVFDIVEALGISTEVLRGLVEYYESFLPIDEVLKKLKEV